MKLPPTLNKENMRNLVEHFPQLLNSIHLDKITTELCREYQKDGVSNICYLGMGGSSIAGLYVQALLEQDSKIPISIVRDYCIPASIDSKSIVIAVSYSGNTEETLSALNQAKDYGCRIIKIASGGKMKNDGADHFIKLPKGLQPRATLPLILSVIIQVIEILIDREKTDFGELETKVNATSTSWEKWTKTPKELANALVGQIPLFIGANHLKSVAYRAKCQINENAKALAFYSEIPEANHNEIEGFTDTSACQILPIFLRGQFESNRISRRLDITYDLYQEMNLNPEKILSQGKTKIEEMLTLTHYLDSVSVEFAELRNVDPVSVDIIQKLKHRLSL